MFIIGIFIIVISWTQEMVVFGHWNFCIFIVSITIGSFGFLFDNIVGIILMDNGGCQGVVNTDISGCWRKFDGWIFGIECFQKYFKFQCPCISFFCVFFFLCPIFFACLCSPFFFSCPIFFAFLCSVFFA